MSVGVLACTYTALILHDDGIPITQTMSVESFWPILFAKLLAKRNVNDLILNAGSAAAPLAVAASAGANTGAAAAAVQEEKEETKEESDDDIGLSLFDN